MSDTEVEVEMSTRSTTEQIKSFVLADNSAFKITSVGLGAVCSGMLVNKLLKTSNPSKSKIVPILVGGAVGGLASYYGSQEIAKDVQYGLQSADTWSQRLKAVGANLVNLKGQTYVPESVDY